jgi:hypothetical protein
MRISTFLFGLLCLTTHSIAPAVSRLLDSNTSSNSDYYTVLIDTYINEMNENNGGDSNAPDQQEEHDGAGESERDYSVTTEYPMDYAYGGTTEVPKDYGYGFAEMIWSDGYYDCDNIHNEYWVDVQNIVFTMCDFKWLSDSSGMWEQYSQECKTGAEQFTLEEMDNCSSTVVDNDNVDVEECSQVGVSAAASVAGTFCKQNGLFQEPADAGSWIPTKCVQHAMVTCKYDAVQTVQRFNQGGVCTQGSALDYIDQIHQLCEQEVSAMEQAANPTVIKKNITP